MAVRSSEFQTIRSEGGLLPADLLRRVLDPKEKLVGTMPADYGLPEGERLNEVITQSWNRLRKHWREFRATASKLPPTETGTAVTNDKWTLPLLRELGYGQLPSTAGPVLDGRTYAISRFLGPVPLHLVGCGVSLDRRAAGVRGAAASNPHGLVQEFLNRSSGHLWAVLSNGLRLRLLRDNQALSRQSFLEFDLEAMFAGEVYSDFVLLWLLGHATRLVPREFDRADTCFLEQWTTIANEQGTRALGDLRGGVERALQILGQGFTSHPKNIALREALRSGGLPLADFHGQLLRVVYRLIFLFVAEDRAIDGIPLLHPQDGSEAGRLARERYNLNYSTVRLRDLAGKMGGSRHGDLWRQFNLLIPALSGDPEGRSVREHLALPILGSLLWNPASTAALNTADLSNHDFLESLRNLAFTRQANVLRPVDYRNLGAEELGGVYESLLTLTPQISADGAGFTFAEFAGNERKTSGSYYTPDSLVQDLLNSALDPVVAEAIRGKAGVEAEKALLALKVCDPAVGSGHFLVGAAHRLARHLSRVRAVAVGETEPSPLVYQHALRDVIGRCLYGVDINPMAAELCRVSLWLEALEPGKPLSFLDHHIRIGNSLLGATPELIAEGIPDDAYEPIEGDDKEACKALKKLNNQERETLKDLYRDEHAAIRARLIKDAITLEEMGDDGPEAVRAKEQAFRCVETDSTYQAAKRLADLWCAAFVIEKRFAPLEVSRREPIPLVDPKMPEPAQGDMFNHGSALAPTTAPQTARRRARAKAEVAVGISTGHLRNHRELPSELASRTAALAEEYGFFHWHLNFPDVFANGGFNCVLGNPPWEKLQVEEQEFFAGKNEQIAHASAKTRKKLIAGLESSAPTLHAQWLAHKRTAGGTEALIKNTGRFPLAGTGKLNTYSLFAELSLEIVGARGRIGCVLPLGLITDEGSSALFGHLVELRHLSAVIGFENESFLFPDVHHSFKFCLLTLTGRDVPSNRTELAFFCRSIEDAHNQSRRYVLTPQDIIGLNPNTLTCPIFRNAREAALVRHVYRATTVISSDRDERRAFNARIQRVLNSTDDVELFEEVPPDRVRQHTLTLPVDRKYEPVYEAKMFHQFDHRFGTYVGQSQAQANQGKLPELTTEDHSDPNCYAQPRWWVTEDVTSARTRALFDRGWIVAFRDITSPVVQRTAICTVLPHFCTTETCRCVFFDEQPYAKRALAFVACFNSLVFDFVCRTKFSGNHLSTFVVMQLPMPTQETVVQRLGRSHLSLEWFENHVLELTYTAWDLRAFAIDCGWSGPPFHWDEERRLLLRAELDAAIFHMYLPSRRDGSWQSVDGETSEDVVQLSNAFATPRHAVEYMIDSFPIVRRNQEAKWGEYRMKRVILEIYDAMQTAIETSKPYQTLLYPPPADAQCCHSTRTSPTLEV